MTGLDVLEFAMNNKLDAELVFDTKNNTVNFIRFENFETDTIDKTNNEIIEILNAFKTFQDHNVI
jgi:hypothetical protein